MLTCFIERETAADVKKKYSGSGYPVSEKQSECGGNSGVRCNKRWLKSLLIIFSICAFGPATVYADDITQNQNIRLYDIDIPKLNAADALNRLAEQTDVELLYPYQEAKIRNTNAVKGRYGLIEALTLLLKGSGLSGGLSDNGVIKISLSEKARLDKNSGEKSKMNKKKSLLTGIAALFTWVAVVPNAAGQENEKDTSAGLIEEIIVTASRREENLQNVAFSVTSVAPDEFETIGQVSIRDIIAYVPGFEQENPTGAVSGGRGSISARGITQAAGIPVVGVYIDDVPVSGNGIIGRVGYFEGALLDIERIEFLKGPQGTLYGANSVGGSVRYITRKPSLDKFSGAATINLSQIKEGSLSQIYSGHASAPIIQDRLGLKVSGYYENAGGLVDFVDNTSGALLAEDGDDADRYGISADLLFQATDRLSIRLRYTHQDLDFAGPQGGAIPADGNLVPTFGDFSAPRNPDDMQTKDEDYFSATISHEFDWATLISVTGYNDVQFEQTSQVFTINGFADFVLGQPAGTTQSVNIDSTFTSERFVQELRLVSPNNKKLEWQAGVYYTKETGDDIQVIISQPGDGNIRTLANEESYEEYAVFGNLTYYLTENLDITAGARLSHQEPELDVTTSGAISGNSQVNVSTGETVDTYMFNLRYRPNDDMSLYARAASGFRPAQTQAPVLVGGVNVAPERIEADDLWSYELGAKGNIANGLLSYDVALFYTDWDNFQTFLSTPVAAFSGNADDGITIKGFEGSATLNLFEGFSITSTLSYTRSSLNENEPNIFGLEGAQTPDIPKWTSSSIARYDFRVFDNLDAHIGAGYRYTSGRNSAYNDGSTPGNSETNVPIDGYVLADLNLGITNGTVAASLYITNLFNKYTLTNASSFSGGVTTTIVPITPRTIGGTISVKF